MWDVLKSTLTRHMLVLFLVLALAPLLVVIVGTGIFRVQNQDRAVRALETDLREKASSQILAETRRKADHLEQTLMRRTAVAVLLAEHGERLFEMGVAGPDLNREEYQSAAMAMAWSVEQDWTVRAAFVSLHNQAEWVAPTYAGRIDHAQLFADWVPGNPPASGEPADIAWRLAYTGQGAVLVLAAPVWSGNHAVGIAGLELWLDRVIEEAPRDSLVKRSSLLLVSSEARFAALQSWNPDSFRWSRLPPLAFKAGRLLSDFLPEDAGKALITGNLQGHLAQGEPLVLPVDLEDQSAYLAFQAIGGTPLVAVLVLPLSEVWNLAEYYGAPLHVALLPLVIETLIAAGAFVLAISLGALFTLRQIAQPIHELSKGARAIMEGRLTHRVPQKGPGELKELAGSFNNMADSVARAQDALKANQDELAHALATRQTQFEVINDVASVTNDALDLSGKLTAVLTVVCPAVAADGGAVFILKDGCSLVSMALLANAQTGGEYAPLTHRSEVLVRTALANSCVQQEQAPSSAMSPARGWLVAVPFSVHGPDQGVIVLERRRVEKFNADDVAFLMALATHVSVLVDNANLQNELRYVVLWEERRRLARELHDSVTQTVFTLSLAAEGLKAGLTGPPAEVDHALDFLVAQAARARQEMRGLINELRPIDLGNESLDQAVRIHASSLQRATGLKVTPVIDGDTRRLSPLIQHNMNRILQEALSNVMRHAGASAISIRLSVDGDHAELQVADDGRGFPVSTGGIESMGSLGLISMRERAEAMGGTLKIASAVGSGATVIARAPLQSCREGASIEQHTDPGPPGG